MHKILLILTIFLCTVCCAPRRIITKNITVKIESHSFVSIESKREYKKRLEEWRNNRSLLQIFQTKPQEPKPVSLVLNKVKLSIGSINHCINSNESIIQVTGHAGDSIVIVDDDGNSEIVCKLSDELNEIRFTDVGITLF